MPTPFDLTGKTILITGASSGIGAAAVCAVAGMGGKVIATGRNESRLEKVLGSLPGEGHRSVPADLTDAKDRERLQESVGTCDGLVHAAGVLKLVPFVFVTEPAVRETQAVNYEAPVLLTQGLLKRKKIGSGGSIVFVTSVAARSAAKGHALYSGAKSALESAVRCLALEVAAQRIRVNCVAPAMVRTGMADEASEALGNEAMKRHEEEYPLGFGEPEDVSNSVAFLLADASRWITGTTLTVDGGFTAR